MKKNNKVKRNTFSAAPAWYDNKKRAQYENKRSHMLREANMLNKLSGMDTFIAHLHMS